MRAFVITAAGQCAVQDVEPPAAGPGQVIVEVVRAGVCGTDAEFFSGHILVSEPVAERRALCQSLGAVAIDPGADVAEQVCEIFGGRPA